MISDTALRRVMPSHSVALLGDLIRWLAWALVFVVWVAFAQVYARMLRLTLTDPSHSDFTIFYYTARLVADGLPMYGVSPSRYGIAWAADHLGNLNPPHFQILALPLAYLSYGQALFAWVAISLACLAASIAIVVRELAIPWTWPRFWLWGAVTISSAAFTTVAVTSEITFVLMLPFALAWRAWRGQRWMSVGAWLGVCASVKLFLLLFVPWLIWRRRWGALATFAVTVAALVSVGAAAFGPASYGQWLTTLGKVGWWWLPMNASWQGLVSRLLAGGGRLAPLVHRQELVLPIAVAGSALVALVTLVAAARERSAASDRQVLLLLSGAVLSSPLGWVYYLPLAFGPMLGWMGAGRGWTTIRGCTRSTLALVFTGLGLLYVPHEATFAWQPSGLASFTAASAYFWGLLLVWVGILSARTA
jgi:hypothetical protein